MKLDPSIGPHLTPRQRRLWRLHDFSQGAGLEVGPLYKPVAPRPLADVKYVDVFDRDQLAANYTGHALVDADLIPDIDYVLLDGDRVRSIPEATAGARFDWVVASHVIEHVPDAIGWLDQIAQVTVDGGALVLVVPDRRYCFDIHRPGTTVGAMLQAHDAGDSMPSVRAVYDHYRSHVFTDTAEAWKGRPPTYERRSRPLNVVLGHLERARAGEYVDAHVWTFTPASFVDQLVELRVLGLSEWTVDKLRPTRPDQLEFVAVLRRLPRDGAADSPLLEREVRPRTDMPDWVAESARLQRTVRRQSHRIAKLQERLATAEKRSLRGRLRRGRGA